MKVKPRSESGRFLPGISYSPKTQFKKGQHWRKPQRFREKEYLISRYVERKHSASDIAADFGVTETAIFFWLKKHGIKRRSISEARKHKKWKVSGKRNGMFGRTGSRSPS